MTYRIQTDGYSYRVQSKFLWFWISGVYEFKTLEEAQQALEEYKKRDSQKWTEIESN